MKVKCRKKQTIRAAEIKKAEREEIAWLKQQKKNLPISRKQTSKILAKIENKVEKAEKGALGEMTVKCLKKIADIKKASIAISNQCSEKIIYLGNSIHDIEKEIRGEIRYNKIGKNLNKSEIDCIIYKFLSHYLLEKSSQYSDAYTVAKCNVEQQECNLPKVSTHNILTPTPIKPIKSKHRIPKDAEIEIIEGLVGDGRGYRGIYPNITKD